MPASGTMDWQSAAIPPTIRRPWRVFEEDLEDKMADAASQQFEVMGSVRERLAAVQARGAHSAFLSLPEEQQRTYAEVSLMELSAYVCWRRAKASRINCGETPVEFEAAWDILDCDDKAEWVPEDPRAVLAADAMWIPLLADGPPECGIPKNNQVPYLKHEPQTETIGGTVVTADLEDSTVPAENPAVSHQLPIKPEGRSSDVQPNVTTAFLSDNSEKPAHRNVHGETSNHGQAHNNGHLGTSKPVTTGPSSPPKTSMPPPKSTVKPTTPSIRASISDRSHNKRSVGAPASRVDLEAADVDGNKRVSRHQLRSAAAADHTANIEKPLEQDHTIPRGIKLAPKNLCPEALDAICCVCGNGEAMDDNDLGLCDRCDRGFHQKCHDPPVAYFGNPEDKWFCAQCIGEIAKERQLRLAVGDFAWVSSPANSPPWPARVISIDFNSVGDPQPYWVQFFDTGPSQGNWVSESNVIPWSESPPFHSIKDSRRKLAVRLAEAKGAEPISGPGPRAPIAPLPASRAPAKARASPPRRSPPRRRTVSGGGPQKRQRTNDEEEEPDYSQQLDEMRDLIGAARERQKRLEREIEEAEAETKAASQLD